MHKIIVVVLLFSNSTYGKFIQPNQNSIWRYGKQSLKKIKTSEWHKIGYTNIINQYNWDFNLFFFFVNPFLFHIRSFFVYLVSMNYKLLQLLYFHIYPISNKFNIEYYSIKMDFPICSWQECTGRSIIVFGWKIPVLYFWYGKTLGWFFFK